MYRINFILKSWSKDLKFLSNKLVYTIYLYIDAFKFLISFLFVLWFLARLITFKVQKMYLLFTVLNIFCGRSSVALPLSYCLIERIMIIIFALVYKHKWKKNSFRCFSLVLMSRLQVKAYRKLVYFDLEVCRFYFLFYFFFLLWI